MVGFLVTLFGMALWSPWDGSEKHQKKAMNETMEMGKTLEELWKSCYGCLEFVWEYYSLDISWLSWYIDHGSFRKPSNSPSERKLLQAIAWLSQLSELKNWRNGGRKWRGTVGNVWRNIGKKRDFEHRRWWRMRISANMLKNWALAIVGNELSQTDIGTGFAWKWLRLSSKCGLEITMFLVEMWRNWWKLVIPSFGMSEATWS